TWPRVACVAVAAALFASARDSDVWIVWALAVVVAVDAVVERRGVRGVALALALAAGAGLLVGSAAAAGRNETNLDHVYFVRVFPDPDRVAWFAAHGMPDAAVVRAYAADLHTPRGEAPVQGIDPADGRLQDLVVWLHEDGAATFARWVVAHPWYLLTEPA